MTVVYEHTKNLMNFSYSKVIQLNQFTYSNKGHCIVTAKLHPSFEIVKHSSVWKSII